ncbi:MAG: aspartate kinase [Phycisphaerales bacterium]|nr:aspartate kinase [Phycisphaerales bacterium]
MKVMKFGGTSVGKPEAMKQVVSIITRDQGKKIVVLSALSGTTNSLVDITNSLRLGHIEQTKTIIASLEKHYRLFIEKLLQQQEQINGTWLALEEYFNTLKKLTTLAYSDAIAKEILAQGELLSTKIFSHYLTYNNITHENLPALAFMCVNQAGDPNLTLITEKLNKLLALYPQTTLFVTQGFICINDKNNITNLQRGGSDYTASLIAASTNACVCEIWTDIDGIHNNDPRIVNKTHPIEQMTYEEAAELAYFGAKILHPTCIWPTQVKKIPVKLLNTMQPNAVGTTIIEKVTHEKKPKSVAAKDGITGIKIKSSRMLLAYGFLRKIFEIFEHYQTPIDMVTTSEVAVSVTIDNPQYLQEIEHELKMIGDVEVIKDQVIIAIVGNKLSENEQFFDNLFKSLHQIPKTMINFGGSEHNISFLIPREFKNQALTEINRYVFNII